jgi:hypothetical protein
LKDACGAIISHFGVLMTFYLACNFPMALSLKSHQITPQSSLSKATPQSLLSQAIEKGKQELDQRKRTMQFEDNIEMADKNKIKTAENK